MSEEILFAEALSLSADQRAAYLDRVCAGNPELRRRLEELLAAHFAASGATPGAAELAGTRDYQANADPVPATTAYRTEGTVGTVIAGRYKLLQQIGEGGMGTVWMAEQTEPVKRKVAVKLIRVERSQSKAILARFEAERQAIALMDHPHIAKLLDAGSTETGSPFFVMELVKGIPLNDFCDQHRLEITERLQLFMQICSAVQHAHQKGIIHRDLKPSNILVESHDGKPVPKVIDFGLAKATTGLALTEQSLFTGFGNVLGTPLYMAPEQATFNAVDVDTRADIYALGIVLYELLTGTTPITRETLKKVALDEMLRLVREQEVPTPSSRLSSSETKANVAANRHTEPAKLGRLVKGELDWIVLKALAKERDRRYETANGFARDIERFLNHEPVSAGPPTAGYRIKKFVQRNRPQVIAASLVFLALLAGIIGTTWGLMEARRQAVIARQEAAAKEKALKAEAAARQKEEDERKFAQAIADFVKDDFLALTSVEGQSLFGGEGLDRNTSLLDLLNRAAGKLKKRKDLDPRIEAELCWIVGFNYRGVGELAKGIPFLERALELRKQIFEADHQDTLRAQNSLATAYRDAGQHDKALQLMEEALKLRKAKLEYDHPKVLESMNLLATGNREAGHLERALLLFEETLKLRKAKLGDDHPETLRSMGHLAGAYQASGQFDKALPLMEATLKFKRAKLGKDDFATLYSMNDLALAYRAAGKLDLALPLLEETLKQFQDKLGNEHSYTLTSMGNLALGYLDTWQHDKALPLLEETLKLKRVKKGDDHPDTLIGMHNLASAYEVAGKIDLAIPLCEEAYNLSKLKLGTDHPITLTSMSTLGRGYMTKGKLNLALPLLEQALEFRKAKLGNDHPDTLNSMNNLAVGYQLAGKLDQALPLLEESLRLFKAKLGNDHPDTLTSMNSLAGGYLAAGRLDQTLPLLEETLELRKSKLGDDHPDTLTSMNSLAEGYLAAGKLDQALPLLEETLKLRKSKLGDDHPNTLTSMNILAMGYRAAGRLDQTLPLLEETLRHRKAKLGDDHPDTLNSMYNLALGYDSSGKLDQAISMYESVAKHTKAKLGPDHPNTLIVINSLAGAYYDAKQFDKATPLFIEYIAAQRRRLPENDPRFAGFLAQVSLDLLKCEQFDTAEEMLRDCLTIREAKEPDAWTTFNTMSMLGAALLGQKKYADAEPLLLKGYEGMKQREASIPPQGAARIPEALDRLIELYTALEKPDEVKKWQAERAKVPAAGEK